MDITFFNLRKLGFVPWDANKEPEKTNWILTNNDEVVYDKEMHCWSQEYRVTMGLTTGNLWQCTAWFSDNSVKDSPVNRRVVVDNIMTVEDIQKVIDICKINKKII